MGTQLRSLAAILTGAALLAGCGGRGQFRPVVPPATNARDLAALDISGVGVTRWQDIANDLEPNFKIDNQKLFDDGLPVTGAMSERLLDAVAVKLAASVSGTVIDRVSSVSDKIGNTASTATDAAGAITSTGSSSTTSQNDSSTTKKQSTPALPPLPAGGSGAGSAPPLLGTRASTVTSDAVTRAANAAGVIQAITQINRSIRDAVRLSGYEPYLVHLSIGMHPRMRDQPFDVLVRLSFLPHHAEMPNPENLEIEMLDDDGQIGPTAPMASNSRAYGAFNDNDLRRLLTRNDRCLGRATESFTDTACYSDSANDLDNILDRKIVPTGMLEDPLRYHIDLVDSDKYAIYLKDRSGSKPADAKDIPIGKRVIIQKRCFFPVIAHYVNTKQINGSAPDSALTAARTYAMFANSARFAAGFYEQFQTPPSTSQCPGFYPQSWRRIYDKRRLQVPRVVPLVQTQNLEGTQDRGIAEQLREASATLSALAGPAALSGSFSRTLDKIEDYETTRFNTLTSISQIGANTIMVKIGARRIGQRFEMQDAPVQVSVLLLVPREQAGDKIEIVARPSFINAETGKRLELGASTADREASLVIPELAQDTCRAAKREDVPERTTSESVMACRQLLTDIAHKYVETADWPGFNAYLARNGRSTVARDNVRLKYNEGSKATDKSTDPEPTPAKTNKTSAFNYSICRLALTENYAEPGRGEDYNPAAEPIDRNVDRVCRLQLWAGLQRDITRMRVMPVAMTELPQVTARNLPPIQHAVMKIKDDIKLVSVAGIDPWLKPYLRAKLANDCIAGPQAVSIMSTGLTMDGDVGTFNFPATGLEMPVASKGKPPSKNKKAAASPPDTAAPKPDPQLCVWIDEPSYTPAMLAAVDGFSAINPEVYPIKLATGSEPKPEAAFVLSSRDGQVLIKADGTATIRLLMAKIKDGSGVTVALSANGSIASTAAPKGGVAVADYTATISANVAFTLNLEGLDPEKSIQLSAQAKKGKDTVGDPVPITIQTRPEPKKSDGGGQKAAS